MHRRFPLPARDGFEVVVGFDQPMCTYFAQVYDRCGEILLDRGDAYDRLTSPIEAIDAVRGYVTEVPHGLLARLLLAEHTPAA